MLNTVHIFNYSLCIKIKEADKANLLNFDAKAIVENVHSIFSWLVKSQGGMRLCPLSCLAEPNLHNAASAMLALLQFLHFRKFFAYSVWIRVEYSWDAANSVWFVNSQWNSIESCHQSLTSQPGSSEQSPVHCNDLQASGTIICLQILSVQYKQLGRRHLCRVQIDHAIVIACIASYKQQ